MRIVTKQGPCSAIPRGAVLMLGYFDGFHVGHMALAAEAHRIQKEKGAPCVAIWTFEHLSKGKAITDNEEKAAVLVGKPPRADSASLRLKAENSTSPAVDAIIFESFDAVRNLSGEQFVRDVLLRQFAPCAVVCGFNFRFGKNGSCGAAELSEICRTVGIACHVVPPFCAGGELVSSTRIRQWIASGDTMRAAVWMTRPYSIAGTVIHGKHLGHTLGFPTVNLRLPPEKVTPSFGIYVCTVTLPDGSRRRGVCNIGFRPTVNGDTEDVTLETYLFDFDGDLYGQRISVALWQKLRDERHFDSIASLSAQIARDRDAAARFFEENEMAARYTYQKGGLE